MLDRLAGKELYYFINGYSCYNQILIAHEDQDKTTLTCPNGTFAFTGMLFGLCNALATSKRCMMVIFLDVIETSVEVFMGDFSALESHFKDAR